MKSNDTISVIENLVFVYENLNILNNESIREHLDFAIKSIKNMEKEFAAYKQAKSKGRLVVLPCKAGDTIYQLRNKKHAKGKGISPRIVTCVTVFGSKMYRVEHQGTTPCEVYELGKTWFLTREAAEAALSEMEEME